MCCGGQFWGSVVCEAASSEQGGEKTREQHAAASYRQRAAAGGMQQATAPGATLWVSSRALWCFCHPLAFCPVQSAVQPWGASRMVWCHSRRRRLSDSLCSCLPCNSRYLLMPALGWDCPSLVLKRVVQSPSPTPCALCHQKRLSVPLQKLPVAQITLQPF